MQSILSINSTLGLAEATLIEGTIRTLIRHVPSALAYALVQKIASRPRRIQATEIELEALRRGRRERMGLGGSIPAWSWGDGPTVALVHGWGGRAAQMAPLAVRLAESGFRAVAFDVAGHGESAEREARWEWFIRDIGDVSTSLSTPLAGFIGHSAGALAMMAARRIRGVRADGFVCICAPHHPYPPITAIRQRLNPAEPVMRMYRNYLGTQFSSDWESLETGFAWTDAGNDLLLCYDKTDRYIDKGDGELINASCPGSALVTYNQYGHTRILGADPLASVVTDFLRSKRDRGDAQEPRNWGVVWPKIALES